MCFKISCKSLSKHTNILRLILYLEHSGYELWLYSVEEPGGGPEVLRVARAPRAGRAQLAHLHHTVRLHVQSERTQSAPSHVNFSNQNCYQV
jgi:hypothetical protein